MKKVITRTSSTRLLKQLKTDKMFTISWLIERVRELSALQQQVNIERNEAVALGDWFWK